MNKRLLIAIVVVSLVLPGAFLAACGGTPQETAVPATEQERPALTEEPTVPATEEATVPATEKPTEEAATPTAEQGPAALDGQSLVEERCTACHNLSRVESAQKTEDEWRTTVERMVGKGAKLNAEEQKAVIQYLAETYGK